MKSLLQVAGILLGMLLPFIIHAQVVYTDPAFPKAGEPVTIYFNASEGTGGLADCNCDVYIHTGVLTSESTSPSDWKYVFTQWGETNPDWQLQPVSGQDNLYSYEITPSIADYYQVPGGEEVLEMAFVFRNGDGTLEGKADGGGDIYYPVFPEDLALTALFVKPDRLSLVTNLGSTLSIRAAASEDSDLSLFDNGNLLASSTNTQLLEFDIDVVEAGTHLVEILAFNGTEMSADTFQYVVPVNIPPADFPAGIDYGITIVGDTSMFLALHAPNKENVFVLGSFNEYQLDTEYQMTQTTDGSSWWIEVPAPQAGDYATFQYLVDGEILIADPYSTLVLDPSNDPFIPEETYPDLPDYPDGKTTGRVTLVQPGAGDYDWQVNDFDRPDQYHLTVYELLLRDFIDRHDYTTLIDTLDYLENLGVNAIELMPINEFEGNISWGYNPSFHMALDKYYGPIPEMKRFVDECHSRGIAVIVDVVYNHAFSQNPLVQLYYDGKPTNDNPWLNRDATHPFNVGFDFNHEKEATKDYFKKIMEYWITEFRLDGFRFDLSKGFTQVNNPDDVGAWGAYDASRIAILEDYANFIWSVDPDFYVILEHFADTNEEKELAASGMMLWGNMHGAFTNTAKAVPSSLTGLNYQIRGFDNPSLLHYMESHDEERIMYSALNEGNQTNQWHDIRELETALRRIELNSAFFYPVPGPKMLWQFGEQGYDINIDFNGRTGPKPILWEYLDEASRRRLYDVTSSLINLRHDYDIFQTEDFETYTSNGNDFKKVKSIHLNSDTLNVTVLGNFHYFDYTMDPRFQHTGTWYEYFSGDSLEVTDVNEMLPVTPGEYRLYTDVKLPEPPMGYIITTDVFDAPLTDLEWSIYPNPAAEQLFIDYQLDRSADVRIELFDQQGRQIQVWDEGQKTAGKYHWQEKAPTVNGTYWIAILIDGQVSLKQIQVIR
ncbi:MAG: T9SS type A sorting domain-containing protein [Bacteroidetes bacterium]|nr:T9SS type A sorting domain-containing protein [Bacteroidota bacterium]